GHTLELYADLSAFAPHHCNDMVVDAQGNAYVGNFGFDIYAGDDICATNIILVRPNGEISIAADNLLFPNGAVITPDNKTFIVGESYGARLAAYDINPDATLSNHRIWANMAEMKPDYTPVPDGICLDAEGALWVASPTTNDVLRISEGGKLLEVIAIDRGAFACMLGGGDGKTLFICAAPDSNPRKLAGTREGQILAVKVDVPHSGRP
ncbi:MAG: SMP-30/gluconolactonase/LRE family protein, partial [Alphaproteobacteria bacterium]|nr:SMP-30/gluconolactonase/LRE family protein [Alphaproteobacteria bacterium]